MKQVLIYASLLVSACSSVASRGGADCDIDFTNQRERSVLHVTHESVADKGVVRLFVAPVLSRNGELRNAVPVLARERDNEFLQYHAPFTREDLVTTPYEVLLVRDASGQSVSVSIYSTLGAPGAAIATGELVLALESKPFFTGSWRPIEWDAGRSTSDDPLHELRIWFGSDAKVEFALLEATKSAALSR